MERKRYLEVTRSKHGFWWWVLVGWWERPIASALWLLFAGVFGFKGVKFHYHR